MTYTDEFRNTVLTTITNLQVSGKLYNRKRHTLAGILDTYNKQMFIKHSMLGANILEKMQTHITHIFNNVKNNTSYEVLDFINCVIKWYFSTLNKCRNRITLEVEPVSLPDYTIPEIKELYESMLE